MCVAAWVCALQHVARPPPLEAVGAAVVATEYSQFFQNIERKVQPPNCQQPFAMIYSANRQSELEPVDHFYNIIVILAVRASETLDSQDALRFSQAALNITNVIRFIEDIDSSENEAAQ